MSWKPDDNLSLFDAPTEEDQSRLTTKVVGTVGTAGTDSVKDNENSSLGNDSGVPASGNSVGTPGTGTTDANEKSKQESARAEELAAFDDAAPLGKEVSPEEAEPLDGSVKRPDFTSHANWFHIGDKRCPPGLWWHGIRTGQNGSTNEDVYIADPIEVIAISRDEHGGNFGRQVRFMNSEGKWCRRVLPMRLLNEGGSELRRELLDMGHTHVIKQRHRLADYIMESRPEARLVAATTTGWHDNSRAFVLPERTIGNQDYCFSADSSRSSYFDVRGTLDGWRQQVAGRAANNPILMLGICIALAGPLIWPAKQQPSGGLGFNLRGGSSKGKTTCLQMASSVWGSPQFMRQWSGTGNGIEALAASQNDTCMVLDEISQASPYEAGNMVYLVANGVGKQRAARTGGIREAQRWRLMLLSSGERSLASHMSEAGKKAKAGQDARLLDIPATSRRYGAFDDTQGMTPSDFANAIKTATAEHYGHAGSAFIQHLIKQSDLPALYRDTMEDPVFTGALDGVSSRAAGAFGLLAMAGELATDAGLTGWAPGSSIEAIGTCFQLWQSERGSLPPEDQAIMEGIANFIQRHGDSRFSEMGVPGGENKPGVRDRAGYWADMAEGRVFYFHRAALEEAASGYDPKMIASVLDKAGWLYEKESGRFAVNKRTPNGLQRLYAVLPKEGDQ